MYNHSRPLTDFLNEINIIKNHGFNPIAVTQMYYEDLFVFKTDEEATKAYHQLEQDENNKWIGKVSGYWYGKEEFEKEVKNYEQNEEYSKVLIYWL